VATLACATANSTDLTSPANTIGVIAYDNTDTTLTGITVWNGSTPTIGTTCPAALDYLYQHGFKLQSFGASSQDSLALQKILETITATVTQGNGAGDAVTIENAASNSLTGPLQPPFVAGVMNWVLVRGWLPLQAN
jgi:hypothetical protein